MSRRYLAFVPINEQGMAEEYMGVEHSPNILEYIISPEEFRRFCGSGAMERVNAACGILLDEYEDDIIPTHGLAAALDIARRPDARLEVITRAIEDALRLGTYVSLYL